MRRGPAPCPATQRSATRSAPPPRPAAIGQALPRVPRRLGRAGAREAVGRAAVHARGRLPAHRTPAGRAPLPHPCLSRPRLAAPAQHRPSAIPGKRPAQCAPRVALARDCPPGLPPPRVLESRSAPPVQSPTPPPSTVQVLMVVAWLVVQALKLCGHRGEPPEERTSEGADSGSDSD